MADGHFLTKLACACFTFWRRVAASESLASRAALLHRKRMRTSVFWSWLSVLREARQKKQLLTEVRPKILGYALTEGDIFYAVGWKFLIG